MKIPRVYQSRYSVVNTANHSSAVPKQNVNSVKFGEEHIRLSSDELEELIANTDMTMKEWNSLTQAQRDAMIRNYKAELNAWLRREEYEIKPPSLRAAEWFDRNAFNPRDGGID